MKIEIILPESGVRAVAELHEDKAPKTCEAFLNALPHEGIITHAKWCGDEVWTNMKASEALKNLPPENQTVLPQKGDLTFAFFGKNQIRSVKEDMYDFAIWYGIDTWIRVPTGTHPMNQFGTVIENLDELGAQCAKTLTEGTKKILINRIE